MGYELGVDLGTTYTAAATHRDGATRIVELGNRAATIPSVVFLTEEDEILTGDAANRRAASNPGRVAREFKRRIGDPTPLLLGGSPYSAESLSARLLEWVIGKVSELEGDAPSRVAVTHPANWGPFKLDLFHQAFRMANLEDVLTLTEPEAAAVHYSTLERIEPGMAVAVFDLGGGTFDAAILRKKAQGFDFLGDPEGIERLGGIDFDAAVFAFVRQAVGTAIDDLDPSDATAVAAVARLRRDCVDAKEALSSDTEVTVPVALPGVHTDIRLTRAEFEQMVRPSLGDSIGAMQRAIRSANLTADDIDLVLLVGGSSRIPLVNQMVLGELGRPVAVDTHPKHSVALGAAWAAANTGGAHLATVTSIVDAQPSADQPAAAAGLVAGAAAASLIPDTPSADTPAANTPAPFVSEETISAPAPLVETAPPAVTSPPIEVPPPIETAPPPVETPAPAAAVAPPVESAPPPVETAPPAAFSAGPSSSDTVSAPLEKPTVSAGLSGAGLSGDFGGSGGSGGGVGGAPLASLAPKAAKRSMMPILLGVGGLAIVIAIGALALTQRGGGETDAEGLASSGAGNSSTDDSSTSTAPEETTATTENTTTTEATTTTEPTTTTTVFSCDGRCAHLTEEDVIVEDDGELLIDWEAVGYTAQLPADHAHFYYDIYDPEQIGLNAASEFGVAQGSWQLTDQMPFSTRGSDVAVENAPADATAICVVAADANHNVINPENFECVPLP